MRSRLATGVTVEHAYRGFRPGTQEVYSCEKRPNNGPHRLKGDHPHITNMYCCIFRWFNGILTQFHSLHPCFHSKWTQSPNAFMSGRCFSRKNTPVSRFVTSLCHLLPFPNRPNSDVHTIHQQYKGPERLLLLNILFLQFLWWIALVASEERQINVCFPL